MAGENINFPLPLIESGQKYAPGSLAFEVLNLQLTADGTLRGVRGPAPLIPDYGSGYPWPGRVFGVYHTRLDRGMREVTLVRSGAQLLEQAGWDVSGATVRSLAPTALSQDPNARFPDQFCEVAGKIVWCNGVDAPLIYDGYRVLPLGYEMRPGAPSVTGPGDTGHPVFRNQLGYSHPGKIGSVGNFFSVQSGAMLAGNWYYYVQFEDQFGNRSTLSGPGGPVVLRQEYTKDLYWIDYDNYDSSTVLYPGTPLGLLSVNLDDLTRQFLVSGLPVGPDGTVARIVYRSQDSLRNDPAPRFLVRIDDNITSIFPDNTPDSGLGAVAKDYIQVPHFGLACEYGGCLVVADGRNIRKSEPGFPGSFTRTMFVPINDEPTGLFSFAGRLYATTEEDIFSIEEANGGLRARPLSAGTGLVAPSSGAATGLGVFVGLGRDGFWSMDTEEAVRPLSEEIRPLFKRLNPGMLSRAAAVWNPTTREYLCALPEAGTYGNSLLVAWDGAGWRRQRHGIAYAGLCVTKDWRRYVLAAGRKASENQVFVLDHEVASYVPPTKTYAYRSQWLRMDALGRERFNVDSVYVGIVESGKGTDITWQTWKHNSRDVAIATGTVEMTNAATVEVLDTLVLGTGRTRTPRLTWKRFDVRIKSVENFAFDLTSTAPMHIAAFSFDAYLVDASGARVSRQ